MIASMNDPERQRFMEDLQRFHDEKGTVLQPEQILGGKKLDLYTIYNSVIAAGGYEQVSNNRTWKLIGEPFHFPSTCTNSAYILKALYTRNLLGWEQEKYWKRRWEPQLDEVKGRTSGTVVRPKDEARGTATAFSKIEGRFRPSGTPGLYLGSPGHIDEEFRSRIILALESTLPNEIDWVFNTLVRFSYSSDHFSLDTMPTLIDHLLFFIHDFFDNQDDPTYYERALQVLHILRNFSFLDINIRPLAHHAPLCSILMKGLALTNAEELTRHCLDILENIAPQVILLNPHNPYLEAMTDIILGKNDRALILGAIRSLTRVAVTKVNEPVLLKISDRSSLLQRLFQFFLLDDEDLMAASLEYFYQYTGLGGGFGADLVNAYPGKNLVGLLVGLLSWKSTIGGSIHGIPAAQLAASHHLPSPIPDLSDYAHLDEPYRCLGWLKEKLQSGAATDTLPLKLLMDQYQARFEHEKPFGLKEFSTVLMIAFPQSADVQKSISGPAPLIDLVLQNIKYKPEKQPDLSTCEWDDCRATMAPDSLLEHLASVHGKSQRCEWKSCHRPFQSSRSLVAHLTTHLTPPRKRRRVHQKFVVDPLLVDDTEVVGVPLTAALILRDLAPDHPMAFRPYESDLASLAIQRPQLAKYILTILSAL